MIYQDQTIMAGGVVPGNCFQAALASVLGKGLHAIPHFPMLGMVHWLSAAVAWLEAEHQLVVNTSPDPTLGYVLPLHIINGQTERGTSHAVLGDTITGEMVHDPHPSRAGLNFINSRFYFHRKHDESAAPAPIACTAPAAPEPDGNSDPIEPAQPVARCCGSCGDAKPVAWMRKDGMKAMIDDEKQGWIAAGNSDIADAYSLPLFAAPPVDLLRECLEALEAAEHELQIRCAFGAADVIKPVAAKLREHLGDGK